jgi:hypothetical protein
MRKVISLAVLLCVLAGSALAAAPESALKALSLGNEKYILEKSLKAKPLAIVVMDESIAQEPGTIFGLAAEQIAAVRAPFGPETGLTVAAKDITAPLILVLGLDEAAVWAVYANTLGASPDLIHAVLKGQVAVQGALLDPETGAVKVIGAHPDQQTMVGRYLLGLPEAAPAPEAAAAEDKAAAAVEEKAAPEQSEPAEVHAEEAAPATHDAAPAAGAHEADAQATEGSGGSSFILIVLFVAALIGAVIFLDKVVLKD